MCAIPLRVLCCGRLSANLRGVPYDLALDERKASEAWARGATEVCLQGGIHPDYTGETYASIVETVKSAAPIFMSTRFRQKLSRVQRRHCLSWTIWRG